MKPADAIGYLAINHQLESLIPDDDGPNLLWLDALDTAIKSLEKQVACPPRDILRDRHESLGKNYYCKCGVMFPGWHDERGRTNYCGNCGQKLMEVSDDEHK